MRAASAVTAPVGPTRSSSSTGAPVKTSASPLFAQRDSEVRLGDSGPRVGVLEKGARVVRWGTGSGAWTPIRIYDVDAQEPPGKNFFVRESDLGNSPP